MADITGTRQAEVLIGTRFTDVIWAGGGNDRISGLEDRDRLYGQAGEDSIYGGDGNDRIGGGDGNDRLFGDQGDDTLMGDGGRDYLWGASGNDQLAGGDGDDVLRGNSGDDVLRGNSGNDLLEGLAGDDLLYGGPGVDMFDGGEGIDTVSFFEETNGVYVHLGGETAADGYPEEVFYVTYETLYSIERVRGSTYDDYLIAVDYPDVDRETVITPVSLFGLEGDDRIRGGYFDDELEGNDGDDHIEGLDGNDMMDGGDGSDFLAGGDGDDRLTGGAGADVFLFRIGRHPEDEINKSGHVTVTDFRHGEDTLRWTASVGNAIIDGESVAGVVLRYDELFEALDSNGDGRISGLDQFADNSLIEGVHSLTVDVSALLDDRLDDRHELKGELAGDLLTLLGISSLQSQDISS